MEGIDASSADSSSPYPGRTLALVTSRTSICCRPGVHGATRGDGTADSHSILPGLSACHDGQEPHTDGLAKGARGGSTQSHSMQWAWVAHGDPSSPNPAGAFTWIGPAARLRSAVSFDVLHKAVMIQGRLMISPIPTRLYIYASAPDGWSSLDGSVAAQV